MSPAESPVRHSRRKTARNEQTAAAHPADPTPKPAADMTPARPQFVELQHVIATLPENAAPAPFIKRLRREVLNGQFEAAYTTDRFTVPGQARKIRNMVIRNTESFERWLNEEKARYERHLNQRQKRTPKTQLLLGKNWETEVQRTRSEMAKRHRSGVALASTGQGTAAQLRKEGRKATRQTTRKDR